MPLIPIPDAPARSILPTRAEAGAAAAAHVTAILNSVLREQETARVIFACAPSQNEFLEALRSGSAGPIDWSRVTAFHMDEYIGLTESHPASFRNYLRNHFLSSVPVGAFHPIRGEAVPEEECARYTALLRAAPILRDRLERQKQGPVGEIGPGDDVLDAVQDHRPAGVEQHLVLVGVELAHSEATAGGEPAQGV